MTKQQLLRNDKITAKQARNRDIAIFVVFALLVVVPFVCYLTNQLAK